MGEGRGREEEGERERGVRAGAPVTPRTSPKVKNAVSSATI